jgi:hypothetical protein
MLNMVQKYFSIVGASFGVCKIIAVTKSTDQALYIKAAEKSGYEAIGIFYGKQSANKFQQKEHIIIKKPVKQQIVSEKMKAKFIKAWN